MTIGTNGDTGEMSFRLSYEETQQFEQGEAIDKVVSTFGGIIKVTLSREVLCLSEETRQFLLGTIVLLTTGLKGYPTIGDVARKLRERFGHPTSGTKMARIQQDLERYINNVRGDVQVTELLALIEKGELK